MDINSKKDSFSCAGCGNCCTEEGYIFLTADEARAIAAFLDIPVSRFETNHTELYDGELVLRSPYRGNCVFLEDRRCTIYPVRPGQCKTFPFWEDEDASVANYAVSHNMCEGLKDTKS